jgi:ferrous iron transport protein A
MKKLSEVAEGELVNVIEINGGDGLKQKLFRLGIMPGTEIKVIRNSIGPIIAEVRGVQIAIGRGMASKIIVIEKESFKKGMGDSKDHLSR